MFVTLCAFVLSCEKDFEPVNLESDTIKESPETSLQKIPEGYTRSVASLEELQTDTKFGTLTKGLFD